MFCLMPAPAENLHHGTDCFSLSCRSRMFISLHTFNLKLIMSPSSFSLQTSFQSPLAAPVIGNPSIHAAYVQDAHLVIADPLFGLVTKLNIPVQLIP